MSWKRRLEWYEYKNIGNGSTTKKTRSCSSSCQRIYNGDAEDGSNDTHITDRIQKHEGGSRVKCYLCRIESCEAALNRIRTRRQCKSSDFPAVFRNVHSEYTQKCEVNGNDQLDATQNHRNTATLDFRRMSEAWKQRESRKRKQLQLSRARRDELLRRLKEQSVVLEKQDLNDRVPKINVTVNENSCIDNKNTAYQNETDEKQSTFHRAMKQLYILVTKKMAKCVFDIDAGVEKICSSAEAIHTQPANQGKLDTDPYVHGIASHHERQVLLSDMAIASGCSECNNEMESPKSHDGCVSLLKLLEDLMNTLHKRPSKPYIKIKSSHCNRHIEMLISWDIAARHPQNEELLRLLPLHT